MCFFLFQFRSLVHQCLHVYVTCHMSMSESTRKADCLMLASLQSSNLASKLLADAESMISLRETELGDLNALQEALGKLPEEFNEIEPDNVDDM